MEADELLYHSQSMGHTAYPLLIAVCYAEKWGNTSPIYSSNVRSLEMCS